MKLYVVRHGQTDWNVLHRLQGCTNIALNSTGIKQAHILSDNIKDLKIDMIFTSPLDRAVDTANIINEHRNLTIQADNALIERSYGLLEGVYGHEYNKYLYWDYDKNYSDNNVEKVQDLFKRVYDFLDSIIEKYNDKNILLVTHNGVSIAINCYFKGFPADKQLLKFILDNCSYVEYDSNEIAKN